MKARSRCFGDLSRGCLVLAVALLAPAHPAAGNSTGHPGASGKQGLICNQPGCHSGGTAPLVRFEGNSQVPAGALATFRFVVKSQAPLAQTHAGFNVAASAGLLDVLPNEGARRWAAPISEITHSTPKANDTNGEAFWDFTWQAPNTLGPQTLFGAGNSVNFNFLSTGDMPAATTLSVLVVAAATPTATATATPTPTQRPCTGDCTPDRVVTMDELLTGVRIALGHAPLGACSAFDAHPDGRVTVDELLQAVNAAANGCR